MSEDSVELAIYCFQQLVHALAPMSDLNPYIPMAH